MTRSGSSHVMVELKREMEVAGYELFTANDFEGRDPIAWQVLGKQQENEEWKLLDTRFTGQHNLSFHSSFQLIHLSHPSDSNRD